MDKNANKLKRGTIREDGRIFWCYSGNGSEYWVTKQKAESMRLRTKKWSQENKDKKHESYISYYKKNRINILKRAQKYRDSNRDTIRNKQYKYLFGIDLNEYNKMFADQNGKCAICLSKCKTERNLCVDHCHKTKKIRGLLCQYCNTAIGKLMDSPEICMNAANYLKNSVDSFLVFK
jgi:hypothetical protein